MSPRLAAWVEIQRQRLAHVVDPTCYGPGWTPRTVDEAMRDAAITRKMEDLIADRQALLQLEQRQRAAANPYRVWMNGNPVRRPRP